MSRPLTAAFLAAAFAAAPFAAAAQETAAPAAQEAAPKAAEAGESAAARKDLDPNRRVCKGVVPTGSRLHKGKICKTAREWALQAETDRANLARMQKQPLKAPE